MLYLSPLFIKLLLGSLRFWAPGPSYKVEHQTRWFKANVNIDRFKNLSKIIKSFYTFGFKLPVTLE